MKIKVLCGSNARTGGVPYEYAGYTFTEDAGCSDYDWLVVFDEMPGDTGGTIREGCERLACPKERTILCTWEPVSIKSYSTAYTRQFGHLLTNRPPEAENHPHYHLGRGYFYWFVAGSPDDARKLEIPKKTKTVSAVCSSKQMRHTRHGDRFRLVRTLSENVRDFDWYGHGVRPLDLKSDALVSYKYHVSIENHIGSHHWTEKLSDALLCECLPFYAGDPDIFEIFPRESLVQIPIDDPVEAARIVNAAISAGEYEKRHAAILEAKRMILEKYNFWAQVISVVEAEKDSPVTAPDPVHPFCIWNRKALRRHDLSAALEDGWLHLKAYARRVV